MLNYFRPLLWRLFNNVISPLFRPVFWHLMIYDIGRNPRLLRYLKVRLQLLDQYHTMFPNAQECSSRHELLSIAIQAANQSDIVGNWLEFGVWSGISINYIAKHISDTIYGFDSFEGLPNDWQLGMTKDSVIKQGTFKLCKLPKVKSNVVLVKGWFNDTLPTFCATHNEPIKFMHIDSDVYESAKAIFDLLYTRINKGTVIVFDEFYNYPDWENNEYKAFNEFVVSRGIDYKFLAYNSSGEQVAIQIL